MTRGGRLPAVTPAAVLRALRKAGWELHRQRGSHRILHKEGVQRLLVIPFHVRDMPKGTLAAILKDAGLTQREFVRLLRG